MFAAIAAVFVALDLLGVSLGSINLIHLAFLFVCIHLAWGWAPWARRP